MENKRFKVAGAGDIVISDSAEGRTGGAKGFHFAVSWGPYGEAGGVLDMADALMLAEHIIKVCGDAKQRGKAERRLLKMAADLNTTGK